MSLHIFGEKETEKKKKHYFKLIECADGINLISCDENGNHESYILSINENGIYINLMCGDVGIKLDGAGRPYKRKRQDHDAPSEPFGEW